MRFNSQEQTSSLKHKWTGNTSFEIPDIRVHAAFANQTHAICRSGGVCTCSIVHFYRLSQIDGLVENALGRDV